MDRIVAGNSSVVSQNWWKLEFSQEEEDDVYHAG